MAHTPWSTELKGASSVATNIKTVQNIRPLAGLTSPRFWRTSRKMLNGNTAPWTRACEVHIWRFDGQGRVARFCHRMDTHKHWLALRGE